jgi:UDP-2,3-diacylglucosamine pyrophosphatase LpxH
MEKRLLDVAVISDLHLGTYACRSNEALAYLKSIDPQILILNGDIIDVWQFRKHYFPSSHMLLIKEIMNMLTNGTHVIYVTGNHDEMLRRYSDLNLGNFQLTDKLVIEIDNKLSWIFHGDVFDNTTKGTAKFWAKMGSHGYAILLGMNRTINSFLKLIGQERVSFSKKIMAHVNKAIIKINDFETTVAEIAIEKKYDFVICGHIHQPQKRLISTKNGSVTYLNSGDWVEHLSALEYYGNDWHIYYYNEINTKTIPEKEIVIPTRVTTDEIAFYLHSLF